MGRSVPQRGLKRKGGGGTQQSASERKLKTPLPRSSGGSASCARSSANTEPDFRTSRSRGPGNRWRGRGSTRWWWWCWREKKKKKKKGTVNHLLYNVQLNYRWKRPRPSHIMPNLHLFHFVPVLPSPSPFSIMHRFLFCTSFIHTWILLNLLLLHPYYFAPLSFLSCLSFVAIFGLELESGYKKNKKQLCFSSSVQKCTRHLYRKNEQSPGAWDKQSRTFRLSEVARWKWIYQPEKCFTSYVGYG